MARASVLYVSYDGMLEPLGQSQVVAYLEGLSTDYAIHLISFEKPEDWGDADKRGTMLVRLKAAGIAWHPLRYHKRPRIVSSVYDLAVGILVCCWIALRYRVRILHARNVLCSTIVAPAKWLSGARLISDIRGFWPDERADGGLIRRNGMVYRVLKMLERAALRRSAHIVTLTQQSVPILRNNPSFGHPTAPISVISTCADLEHFDLGDHAAYRPPPAPVMGYVGSIGTWYMFSETVALFKCLQQRDPQSRFLILNRRDHAAIGAMLRTHAIPPDSVEVVAADFSDVPVYLRRMSFAAAVIRPDFSKKSSAPTKTAEYLGCGLPCIGTAGVGDMEAILEGNAVGVALRGFDDISLDAAVARMLSLCNEDDIRERCRRVAEDHFSLQSGIAAYRAIYDCLGTTQEQPA